MADRMTRRQSLAALAKSRGATGTLSVTTGGAARHISAWASDGLVWVGAPTRRAAEAGLRAALDALPARKDGKR